MARKFKFEVIPLADVPSEDAVTLPDEKKPLVLVVDDERIIADTLSIILSRNGFSTVTAYDGLTGLELAQSVRPDLLISDVMMPGMTGVELAIALTHAIPTCRILLFSGQAATVDLLEKAREAGHAFTTLAKPVHPTDMLKRVRDCLFTQHAATNHSSSPAEDSSQLPTYLVN